MEFINYFLTSTTVALGLFSGLFLGWIAKEELKPGKKYLILFQHLVLVSIIIFMIYFKSNIYFTIVSSLIILYILYNTKMKKQISMKIYILLTLIFYESSLRDSFIIQSVLIFMYSLPSASLAFMNKEGLWKITSKFLLFILLTSVLFFII